MEFFRIHKTIPFMRYSHILNSVSIVSFLFAVYWIFTHGLAFSIEFTGGTQVVVNYPETSATRFRKVWGWTLPCRITARRAT